MQIAVLLLPIFLIIMVAIKIDSDGPVFFIQKRVGLGKTHFGMIKFRTMYTETPSEMPTHLLNDPDRWITPVGKILRKTSLDELPQLSNVFKGEMSLVGPRPPLPSEVEKYKLWQRRRLSAPTSKLRVPPSGVSMKMSTKLLERS